MKLLSIAAALALVSGSTLAAGTNPKLEEITVTSSRIEMPLREVATSISVVTLEDIEVRGFNALANVLRYEPGITVSNNGGPGKATELGIRGERGYRTKVYIDGIDLTDTSTPQSGPNFAHLSSAGIERVEILRGTQGMMYGADAGGVVNITTVRPQEGLGGSINAEYGRFGTLQFGGHLAGGNETVDFSLFGSKFETDGFNALTTDASQDEDGYDNETLHARIGWNVTESLRAELVARKVDGDNEYDDCSLPVTFDPSDNCSNDHQQEAWRVALVHDSDAFSNRLSFNKHETDREFFSAGLSSFATEGDLEKVEYLGSWNAAENFSFVYGIELLSESVDDSFESTIRDQNGYFLEYQGKLVENLFVTAGVRYDDNDDFGTETTYRTSAAYLIPSNAGEYKIRGSYGTGFRAPSLSEIAYNRGANASPPASNVELAAETSEGYEVGAAFYADAGWLLELTYFDQRTEDEIFFDLDDFSGYLQGNGESSSEGIELVGEFPLGDTLVFTGNYTYNETEDVAGFQRIKAPENLANLGLRVNAMEGKLTLNLNLRITRDSADQRDGAVEDYETVDFGVSYQAIETVELYARIENLTDENYQEIPNYNVAGAAGYAGVRITF